MMSPYGINYVTPNLLKHRNRHRWFVFPHSFTDDLVTALIKEWGLGEEDQILDPFVGAGTTVLAAKEKGIPAIGYDLSPLAVFVARAKVANYDVESLEEAWGTLATKLKPERWNGDSKDYAPLVSAALPGRLLGAFEKITEDIKALDCEKSEKDFFKCALLGVLPRYSRAVATGGWLSWVDNRTNVRSIPRVYSEQVCLMFEDLKENDFPRGRKWRIKKADARRLPDEKDKYSAVITSPPYPNRHDYTRVFGVELMFAFLDSEKTKKLRYQTIHSHPEAKPIRPDNGGYAKPLRLARAVSRVTKKSNDPRVPKLLEGYFEDMYHCLREVKRVCKKGAKVAFVVGNAQYVGVPILVDELLAEIGEDVGLSCKEIRVVRYRGNSAQQMGRYGRNKSRESIVVFEK